MILLDTTVIVDFLRDPVESMREVFIENEIAVSGVTRAEILHGAKNETDYRLLQEMLDRFDQIVPDIDIWDQLGRNLFLLRGRGVAVPFPDALIATLAIQHDLELWTRDAHFAVIQSVLPELRLWKE